MIKYLHPFHLTHEQSRDQIFDDTEHDYYWSDDFSTDFYIALAKAGFISVGIEHQGMELLLPQLQFFYALLDHQDLHVSHHVKKLLRHHPYHFSINRHFSEVIEEIKTRYEDCWIHAVYEQLLYELFEGSFDDFKLISAEISDPNNHTLAAAEIGYLCDNIYTGLTKFSRKEKAYTNWGTLQRVVLTQYLTSQGIHFSNLGHPQMQYKLDLGARIYPRKAFLETCGLR